MSKLIKFLWKWSWVLTLPVMCVFLIWLWGTLERYATFSIRYEVDHWAMPLHQLGVVEAQHMARVFSANMNPSSRLSISEDLADIPVINLYVAESELAKLNESLPQSGFEYVRGRLLSGNELMKIKYRYRGDYPGHWAYFKKSLRIKTSKSRLYHGMRSFNLIAPKFASQMNTYLGYQLATDMGLIAPKSELVQVVLNGEYRGLHVLVEQLDESTLRRRGFMPGDIYGGELLAKDKYQGVDSAIFDHPGLWKKVAVNNHYPEESKVPLEYLISLMKSPSSEEVHEKISNLLDMEAWGKFSAYETLSRSFHYDDSHNWRLYYDPARSKFVPIVWDPSAWTAGWITTGKEVGQQDVMPSRLHAFLYQNSDFIRARQQAIADFFASGVDQKFLSTVDSATRLVEAVIPHDVNTRPVSEDVVLASARSLKAKVIKSFEDVRHGYISTKVVPEYNYDPKDNRISLQVSGRQPVRKIKLRYRDRLRSAISLNISYWQDGIKITKDISGSVYVNSANAILDFSLVSHFRHVDGGQGQPLKQHQLEAIPAYYEITVNGVSEENELIDLYAVYYDGNELRAVESDFYRAAGFSSQYKIVNASPSTESIVWKGSVKISGIQEITSDIIIEPGTTLYFDEGAGLIISGHVKAQGTPDKPISFVSMTSGQAPWGSVVLKGSGANGSIFSHCEFSNGSGLKSGLYEYSAMLSVHDVDGVDISYCKFKDSHLVDDMFHAVYSSIKIKHSSFIRAYADALDVDISFAVIEDSRFLDSGNDAIDLMTTDAVVLNSTMVRSGDKGISVGEGSRLLAINNVFESNNIGVQSKDGSIAVLHNTSMQENKSALDAYKKNWRYDSGGFIYVYKSILENNAKQFTADKKSLVKVYDSYVGSKPALEAKQKRTIYLDETVDSINKESAIIHQSFRFPGEVTGMDGFVGDYYGLPDIKRRGSFLGGH